MSVKSAVRKDSRSQGKPGVVIASFQSAEDKEAIMKKKSNLKESRQYKDVYIHHDQSYEQRIMANNFKAVLGALKDRDASLSLRGTRVVRGNQRSPDSRDHHQSGSGQQNRRRNHSGNGNSRSDNRSDRRHNRSQDRNSDDDGYTSRRDHGRDNSQGGRGGRGRRGGGRGRSDY